MDIRKNSKTSIKYKEDKANVHQNHSRKAEFKQRSEMAEKILPNNNCVNIIKHEVLEANSETDLKSVDSNSWFMVVEGTEHIFVIQVVKEETEIIQEIVEDNLLYCLNEDKFKYEPHEKEDSETGLVNLNLKNKVVFKEDTGLLYENHIVKEELVLGPETIQENVHKMPLRKEGVFGDDKIINLFKCDYCKKKFDSRAQICGHMKKAHMELMCKKINKISIEKRKQNLQKGQRIFDKTCKTCNRKFCLKSSLMKHIKSHNNRLENADKICDICGQVFASVQNVMRHLKIVHAGIKPYTCNECGKSYRDKADFLTHYLNTHASLDFMAEKQNMPSSLSCQFCNKPFGCMSRCSFHETYRCTKNINKKLKKFNKKPNSSKLLTQFTCETCHRKYNYLSSLKHHMKTHLGTSLLFQCDICDKIYTKKANLKSHIQIRHMNLRVHSCDKCKSTYTSSWALTYHKKQSCPRTYECSVCHWHFKKINGLTKHMKKHHTNCVNVE